jgi:DNA-binding response OmpR family regulator
MNPIPIIFVIDDNAMLRELIKEQLQKTMQCKVILFAHADQVLDSLESENPDLLILDYEFEIPELKYHNGLQFLTALRNVSNVPVIALSGQTEKEIMSTIVKHGANDYIPKDEPQFMEALMGAVQTILTYKETQRQLRSSVYNVNTKFVVVAIFIMAVIIALGLYF